MGYADPVLQARDFRSGYVRRVVDQELDELFGDLPAILLDGPKGVGKTETALARQDRSADGGPRHRPPDRRGRP